MIVLHRETERNQVKDALRRFVAVASDRKYRPVEVWVFRLVSGYVAVKLGIKAVD